MRSLKERLKPPLQTKRPLQTVRIVGLNGSPHRDGNTATLMRWVLEGCGEAGAEVEKGWFSAGGTPERQVP